jgi:hypothetical protein
MEEKLLKRMENFRNTPDRLKFELLRELSELPENEQIVEFLLNVIENEKYDRIRINAVMNLKNIKNKLIEDKLKTIFSFEHDKSVKLVIVETLGERDTVEIDDFFQKVVLKDPNDVVRATAIRKLHERKNLDDSKMLDLLMEIILTDSSVFPKQISLSALPYYADESTYKTLKNLFKREEMHQLKKLLFKTLKVIAEDLELELDVDEPLDPVFEDTRKARKKRRKERRKKKMGKDDYLYF